jgi:hypothetical protein
MNTQAGLLPDRERTADHIAINDILYLHSRGLDRLDADLIKCAYWPDAEVDYGSFKGGAHLFAELVVGALEEQYELTRHSLSNTLIVFTGDNARTESVVSAAHLLRGGQEELLFYGRYLDLLHRRDGQWKLQHRQVVMDWSNRLPVKDERGSDAFADLAKGGHRDNDPLYPFLASSQR